jgi:hypothetical protein
MEPEIYKITSYNSDGKAVVIYALPNQRSFARKMMVSEYGNIEEEGMSISDLPEEVGQQLNPS